MLYNPLFIIIEQSGFEDNLHIKLVYTYSIKNQVSILTKADIFLCNYLNNVFTSTIPTYDCNQLLKQLTPFMWEVHPESTQDPPASSGEPKDLVPLCN